MDAYRVTRLSLFTVGALLVGLAGLAALWILLIGDDGFYALAASAMMPLGLLAGTGLLIATWPTIYRPWPWATALVLTVLGIAVSMVRYQHLLGDWT